MRSRRPEGVGGVTLGSARSSSQQQHTLAGTKPLSRVRDHLRKDGPHE